MFGSSCNSTAGRDSARPDSLAAAIAHLRAVSRDRVRHTEIPGTCQRLREIMLNSIVMPLWQQADDETDHYRRFLLVALADHLDQYIQLLSTPSATAAPPADGCRPKDPLHERTRILGAIRRIQKELGDDDFNRL